MSILLHYHVLGMWSSPVGDMEESCWRRAELHPTISVTGTLEIFLEVILLDLLPQRNQ